MKIGIDGSSITPNKAGVGYYTFSLIKALEQVDSSNEYFIFTNNSLNLSELNLKDNFKIIEIKSDRVSFFWIYKVVNYAKRNKFDAFFSPSNFSFGILYNKTVQVIHDLAPIKYPKFFSKKGSVEYKLQLDLALRRCKAIFTTSETIKNEVVKYAPNIKNKIIAGGFGIHAWAYENSSIERLTQAKAQYTLPEKFFLSVSTLEPRKNYINTILAFEKFYKNNKDFHYIIVGKKGWFFENILEAIKKCEARSNIHLLGYVPEEDLGSIYDLSKGVIMLSFYEGIGLSALEADARGIPVLASDIPIFHEVLKEDVIFANPNDSDEIEQGLEKLKMADRKGAKSDSQYKWTSVAEKLLEVLQK